MGHKPFEEFAGDRIGLLGSGEGEVEAGQAGEETCHPCLQFLHPNSLNGEGCFYGSDAGRHNKQNQ